MDWSTNISLNLRPPTKKLIYSIEKLKADGSNNDVWRTQVLKHWRHLPYAEGMESKPIPMYPLKEGKLIIRSDPTNLSDIEELDQASLEM